MVDRGFYHDIPFLDDSWRWIAIKKILEHYAKIEKKSILEVNGLYTWATNISGEISGFRLILF